MKISDYYPK